MAVGGSAASSRRDGGLRAAFDVERGLEHDRGVGQDAGGGQRALVAVQPLAAGEVYARPGDRADAPVAEREQVLGRGARAGGVGGGDGRDALVERHARVDDDERVALAAQHLELGVGLLGQHQHRAVSRTVHEAVEQRDLALVVVERRAHAPCACPARTAPRRRPRGSPRNTAMPTIGSITPISPVRPPESARALRLAREAVIAHDAQHGAARLGRDARAAR